MTQPDEPVRLSKDAGAVDPSQPGYAPVPQPSGAPVPYGTPGPSGAGSVGKVRGTGISMLLYVVTIGIYGLVWYYKVHNEMKQHSGNGLGGGIALLIALFAGIAMPFVTSSEVGELYGRNGRAKPVSGITGLWAVLGALIIVGPIVWFVKTNGALNEYWKSQGASA